MLRHACVSVARRRSVVRALSSSSSSFSSPTELESATHQGTSLSSDIPEDVAQLVEKWAKESQTSASLQVLMKTGR
eukprot:scaffold58063_cov40-Attheya_sp.AAC.1